MRVTVVAFHPESAHVVETRVQTLFEPRSVELDFVFPSFAEPGAEEDEETWTEIREDLETRLAKLERPFRLLHLSPGRFADALLLERTPAVVVVAYTQLSERVTVAVNALALRRFPVLMLGYRPS